MRLVFAYEPCNRCAHQGRATDCLTCEGTGKVLTAAGSSAFAAYRALLRTLTVRVEMVKPGDRIRVSPGKRHANRVRRVKATRDLVTFDFDHQQLTFPTGALVYRSPTDADLRTFADRRIGVTLTED